MNKSWKRQFAVIYAGQAFSILGSAAVQFAVIWWLTVQTESAVTLSVSTLAALCRACSSGRSPGYGSTGTTAGRS